MSGVTVRCLTITVLCALLAVPVYSETPSFVRIASVDFGCLSEEVFLPRPTRIFNAGETVAVKVRVAISSPASGRLTVKSKLIHPLGPALSEASAELEVPTGLSSWEVLFRFGVGQRLPAGYYRVAIEASLGAMKASHEAAFLLLAPASLENRVELEYELELSGNGVAKTLLLALPSDPALEIIAGPIVTPKPSSIVSDELGNRYALFEGLEVKGSLRIKVALLALQRVELVTADALLTAPLPPEAREFLEPSPYIESSAPEIVSIAEQIVSGAATYREALSRIADFVSSHLSYDESLSELPNYRKLGALWALNARKGACLQFSRLYVALARAAGIPARVVEGLDVKPPCVAKERYTHAYVEVYLPGYGWLSVEPQYPGLMVGLTPPAPGYIAVIRGSDKQVRLESELLEPPLFLLKYAGSLSASLSYTALMMPLEPQLRHLTVDVQVPSEALYSELLMLKPEATARGAMCEVHVRSPTLTFLFSLSCGRPIEVELNETGSWTIEVFAWAAGYEPFYLSRTIEVKPRPLNLTVRIAEAMLLRHATIIVQAVPPIGGARVLVKVESCYFVEQLTAETTPEGVAMLRVGPLFLPCSLHVSASASMKGYTSASAVTSATVMSSPELLIAVALLALLFLLLRRRQRAEVGEGSRGELPEPWV